MEPFKQCKPTSVLKRYIFQDDLWGHCSVCFVLVRKTSEEPTLVMAHVKVNQMANLSVAGEKLKTSYVDRALHGMLQFQSTVKANSLVTGCDSTQLTKRISPSAFSHDM